MRRMVIGSGLAALCAAVLLGAGASSADACGWSLFGRSHSAGYTPSYASYGYSPSYVTYGYAPSYTSFGLWGASSCCPTSCCPTTSYAAPSCCPTSCCPTSCCPTSCCPSSCPSGNCPGGDCAFNYDATPSRSTPTPAQGSGPRTFREPQDVGEPMADEPMPQSDPGFQRRAPRDEAQEDDVFGPRGSSEPYRQDGPEAERTESFRPPNGTIIQQRESAPADSERPEGEESSFEDAGPQIGPLNMDDRITWRTPVQRTRITVAASYRTPQVTRGKIEPGKDWTPVADVPTLVKK